MSLVQHVTANEGIDRVPQEGEEEGTEEILWRTLSYDVFAPGDGGAPVVSQETTLPNTAAYKVSAAKRAAQVGFAIIACWFAAGIVYGFASLKPILIAEGVYSDACPPSDEQNDKSSDSGERLPCPAQDMRLNLFFIAASIATNTSSLLAGWVLDRYGRRLCYVISGLFMIAGCLLMGLAFQIPGFDGYLLANILLSLGGTFVFVSSFQLANAFPKHSGIIVAIVTGAFDGSAAIFLFYRLAWEASGRTFAPARFFFGYAVVGVLLLAGEWALMPARAYHSTPELERKLEKAQDATRDAHDSDEELRSPTAIRRMRGARQERRLSKLEQIEELVGDEARREDRAQAEADRHAASGVWGVLHGVPAHRQMLTPWFVLLLLLTVLQMLRMNYFIATVRSQYRYLLRSDKLAEDVNHFFDVALPVGGVFATPFIGLLLNNLSVATASAVITLFIALIGVLNCLPQLWAGYATVVAFVLFRPLYYSAVSDFATKIFGFATFGRIYGTITCLSGLVNFVQSGLDALTHGPLEDDPTIINAVMAAVGTVLGVTLTTYIIVQGRLFRAKLEKNEAAERVQERLGLIREEREAEEAGYGTIQ
ncbi:putative MFS transporter [Annulohypoxylon truncatum]|uniref:putative MFS transporter n=1 Tax=Annulohypoxylon truncatum TaxID=327061 RepID=UPI002008C8C1|nr:putative MFS transporter [Annulohypoxylon truncatum]KAI1209560.1 putative MFS transporter [Annulohypoxylon truncatum]